jgi:hypothetical protein
MAEEIQDVPAAEPSGGPVVAKAGRYYRVARYLMVLLLFGYGAWSIYDGFYSWPNWTDTHPWKNPRPTPTSSSTRSSASASPPMGLIILGWALYNSRGEYRLENGILHVPGHPPIPLEKIQSSIANPGTARASPTSNTT